MGKKYPILLKYQSEVNIPNYAYRINVMLDELQKKYHFNEQNAMLVLKDILYNVWKKAQEATYTPGKSRYLRGRTRSFFFDFVTTSYRYTTTNNHVSSNMLWKGTYSMILLIAAAHTQEKLYSHKSCWKNIIIPISLLII